VRVGSKSFEGLRIELDSVDISDLIAFTEEKILATGVEQKVVPNEDYLQRSLERKRDSDLEAEVGLAIDAFVNRDAIEEVVLETFEGRYGIEDAPAWIEQGLSDDKHRSWRGITGNKVSAKGSQLRPEIREAAKREIMSRLREVEEE
jgi:hypothetical protein